MNNTYKTSQVGKITGIHPNTVRLYEELGLIPKPQRLPNGYRVFTDVHIEQIKLLQTGLKVAILQSGLRKKIIHIIKLSANGEFAQAIISTNEYINQVQKEQQNAEEAIRITENLLSGVIEDDSKFYLTRKQAAKHLGITIDTLRNWELNGLYAVKRKENGYRIYTKEDINQFKIIIALRCANYSLAAILRMLQEKSHNPTINIKKALNTPKANDDIISVCDELITSLQTAKKSAETMLTQLEYMNLKFNNPPL